MQPDNPPAPQNTAPAHLSRVAMGVSYNGQRYSGWQSQLSGNTIQDHLEAALGRFATHRVSTLCAGRTDAGVHGLMQVVHFDTPLQRPASSWVRGTNTFLPADIAVQWAQPVPDGFHARASATARRYAYVLLQSPVRPSVDAGRVGWVFYPLDHAAMLQAAQQLLGEHDFTSLRLARPSHPSRRCSASRSPARHPAWPRRQKASRPVTGASNLKPTLFCTT